MIDIFKNWISSMLCVGIFVTFITLIIPQNKMRKYIYSLIGVVTIFTLVSPVIKFVNTGELDNAINEVIDNVSVFSSTESYDVSGYENIGEDMIKKEFSSKLKNDISSKLILQNVYVNDIQVFLSKDYNIEKVEVKIKKLNENVLLESVNKVVDYINQEYDIEYSKITVVEEE